MAKLVAISGTHGCGKSTLLNAIKEEFPRNSIYVDEFKASRTVQKELGIDLSHISDLSSLLDFQSRILEAKAKNDLDLLRHEADIVIVERSFLDLIAYTQLWLYELDPLQNAAEWFTAYAKRALSYQRIYATTVLISSTDKIPFEVDPNRGAEDTRLRFEFLLRLQLCMFDTMFQKPSFHITRDCVKIKDRIDQMKLFIPQILNFT